MSGNLKNEFDYNLEVLNIEGESFTTGNKPYIEVCQMIENKVDLPKIYDYCLKKSNEKKLIVKEVLKASILNYEKPNETGEDKFKAYNLAMKIQEEGELTSEDKVALKEAVGHIWKREVVGFIWKLIK